MGWVPTKLLYRRIVVKFRLNESFRGIIFNWLSAVSKSKSGKPFSEYDPVYKDEQVNNFMLVVEKSLNSPSPKRMLNIAPEYRKSKGYRPLELEDRYIFVEIENPFDVTQKARMPFLHFTFMH